MQNLNTLMAVVGGLTHSALARLSKTNACIPQEVQMVSTEVQMGSTEVQAGSTEVQMGSTEVQMGIGRYRWG